MADTITTAQDVTNAVKNSEKASYRAVKHMEELQSGEREATAEAYNELEGLLKEATEAKRVSEEAQQEYQYDYALQEAVRSPGGAESVERNAQHDIAQTLNQVLWDAFQGKYTKVSFEPPKRNKDTDSIRCDNPMPNVDKGSSGSQITFQSVVHGPDEIINPLFSPPASRKKGSLQEQFDVTTSTDNSPLFIEYYNQILTQDVFAGGLLDPMCVNTIDVDHTANIDIPGFGTHPASVKQTEAQDITGDDSEFDERVLYATQWGSDMSVTNRLIRGVQVPNIVSDIWGTLLSGLNDACNEILTTGTGAHGNSGQPHGVYTAAKEAYQSANSEAYEGVANKNYGSDNRNKITVDPDNADKSQTNLERFSLAYGMLDPSFHRSPKTALMAHQQYAMTLVGRTSKGFETNDMYSWVNFNDKDVMKGIIYSHLGIPVIHNPWLKTVDGSTNNELFVMGDFQNFWVRRSRIEMFVSDHVEAKKDMTYLRLLMYLDGRVVKWSPFAGRVGPFVYGTAG